MINKKYINGKAFIEFPAFHCAYCGAIQMVRFKRNEEHEIVDFEIDSESHIPNCKQYDK